MIPGASPEYGNPWKLLKTIFEDRRVPNLLGQYLRRSSGRGGVFWDYERGISLGCPLSPLMGAFFLKRLDG